MTGSPGTIDDGKSPALPEILLLDPLTRHIAGFLTDIGLSVRAADIVGHTFLPGILIEHGTLVVDEARLRFPCDLLHEAGHLAVVPPAQRAALHHNVGSDPARLSLRGVLTSQLY